MSLNCALRHFLFVGSFRIDEVSDAHMVKGFICSLPHPIHITITNLTSTDLSNMLQVVFGISDHHKERIKRVQELAELLHRRTDGNIFYVLEILDYLQAAELLTYDTLKFCWTWNLNRIQDLTNLSENMIDIVITKIRGLPEDVCEFLQFCSLLGFRTDQELVMSVFRNIKGVSVEDIQMLLGVLTKEGLLESFRGRLKFVHDKVYQVATELNTNAHESHLMMGRELRKQLDDATEKAIADSNVLFACVNHLNLASALIFESNERANLAKLNLMASKAASRMSAFVPAMRYAELGFNQVDRENCWVDCYSVTLELATSLSEIYSITGNVEKLAMISKEVLSNGKTIDAKLRVHVALTRAPIREKKIEKRYAGTVELFKMLGIFLPTEPTKEYGERASGDLKQRLRALSDEDILSLCRMTRKEELAAMEILGFMTTEQIISSKKDNLQLDAIVTCMVNLTLDHGLCSESSVGLSFLGARLASSGEIELAQRFAKLSRTLLDVPGFNGSARSRVLMYCCLVLHWSESLSSLTDHALEAFNYGLRHGDTTSGFSVRNQFAIIRM